MERWIQKQQDMVLLNNKMGWKQKKGPLGKEKLKGEREE